MAYATIEDLETRWRALSPTERNTAALLLEDAEIAIHTFGTTLNPCEHGDREMLGIVSCYMVREAMKANSDAFGLNELSGETAWMDAMPAGTLKPWNYRSMLQPPRRNARIGSVRFDCE